VQNMAAIGVFARSQEIGGYSYSRPDVLSFMISSEFKALEGSLSMMSKVLNDVLDFVSSPALLTMGC
jgi:ABC-type uncharacterized transport system permease subunit